MPTPTKTGYTFIGWTGTGLGSLTKTVTVTKGSVDNRTYTANWEPLYTEVYGSSFNSSIKKLAGTDTSESALNNNIKGIRISNSIPNGVKVEVVSPNFSPGTLKAYFSNGIIYLVNDSPEIRLRDGNYICSGLQSLTDISAFSSFKLVVNSGTLFRSFYACKSLTNLQPLSNWDVSGIYNLWGCFNGCSSLTNLNGLNNWNVSSVRTATVVFNECTKLNDWRAINGWNLTSCTDFTQFARKCTSYPSFTKIQGTWNKTTGTFNRTK